MKLTNNHKIILGLAIGGGIAWWLTGKKSATNSTTKIVSTPEDLSREEKIGYILETMQPNDAEVSTGFSGERFEYDPRLGYSLPSGVVRTQSAGGEMVLPREGNLAQEVFFNADGEETDNPVEEAESILDALTNQELNIAFKMSKARRKNPKLTDEQIADIIKLSQKDRSFFKGIIKERFNDVKALSKHPNWRKGLGRRLKMKGMSKEERMAFREQLRAKRKDKRGKRKERRKENNFRDEVINREGGSMWGGYRNDGRPTNSDANNGVMSGNWRGRGTKYNERGR